MSLYPNAWQGPLSTSLFWRWLGLTLALSLHGAVCTRYRVLGLATTLVLAVVPYLWLENRLARRGKTLAPLWPGDSTVSERGSTSVETATATEVRHRGDWERAVPSSRTSSGFLRRGERRSSGLTTGQQLKEQPAPVAIKPKTRRRANSVAFACRTDYGLPDDSDDSPPKNPLLLIAEPERRRSATSTIVESTKERDRATPTVFTLSWGRRLLASALLKRRCALDKRRVAW